MVSMSEYEGPADVDLESYNSEAVPPARPPEQPVVLLDEPPTGRPALLLVVLVALGLSLIAGTIYLRRARPQTPASTAQKSASVPSTVHPEAGEQIPLPPLEQTDPLVRQLVGRLSSNPTVAAWLTTDGLIQNFVVVTSRIASGETPVAELKQVGAVPPFRTRISRDVVSIDPASYHRYDRYAAAVAALDARGTAKLYMTLKPRVLDAYKKMGSLGSDFDPVLERAIIELLKVPVVQGDLIVVPKGGVDYAFADPRLEGLTAAQKQLLRMGPQNMRAIQDKLREISPALGIPESRLPPSTSGR
jgi:Protein of unknown function (DUF3014)